MAKLNYKIIGRRPAEGSLPHDLVDVEWRHADGPITTTKFVPVTHPPEIRYEEVTDQVLDFVPDQVSVPSGTPDSIVMQILEEKRARLADNLGVKP